MNTCRTCIHWENWSKDLSGDGLEGATYTDLDKVVEADRPNWGTCSLIEHAGRSQPRGLPAFTMDSSDYWGRLNCREDFGCNLHEVREPAGALATPPPPGSPGGPPEDTEDEETVTIMSASSPDPIAIRKVRPVPRIKDPNQKTRPRLPDGLGQASAVEGDR